MLDGDISAQVSRVNTFGSTTSLKLESIIMGGLLLRIELFRVCKILVTRRGSVDENGVSK